jgi:hypothetical protein
MGVRKVLTTKLALLGFIPIFLVSCSEGKCDENVHIKTAKELSWEDSTAFSLRLQSDSIFRAFTEKNIDRTEYLKWLEYSYRVSLAAGGQELTIDAIDNSHGHPADYNRPFVVTEPQDIDRLRKYLQQELSKPDSSAENISSNPEN